MSKICAKCNRTVEDSSKFCPYCKCQSFRPKHEIMTPDNSVVHRMFYSNYDGYYVISKAKVSAIIVFLLFSVVALVSGAPGGILFFAVIFAALIYVLMYAIRQIIGKPSRAAIVHNDYGLLEDLKHLFLCWQNKEGGFVISKTKVICHLIFLAFFALAFTIPTNVTLFFAVLFALVFEVPAFVIGYVIHKLVNPNPEAKPKEIKPKKQPKKVKTVKKPTLGHKHIVSDYLPYISRLDELNANFIKKDKAVRELITKRFEPPQLTYTRFISIVDKSKEIFNKNLNSAFTMIDLADEYSPRIASEIEARINVLESIVERLDALANELILNDDLAKDDGVDDLISEMDSLIGSVRDYD